jgi:LacI family transcriptional regulator
MNKKPSETSATIYDVAKLAGVSIATVSRVLNFPEVVSDKTSVKVLEAIDALGYIPKTDARDRARKEVGHIGVITPFFTLPSFSQRLRGIATALVDSPYNLTVYPVDSQKRLDRYLTVLPYSKQVAGLIIVSLPVDELSIKRLRLCEMPTLLFENHITGFSSIEIDNQYGGILAAEHFIKKDYYKCAYVGDTVTPKYTLSPEDERLAGYRQTLINHDIPLPDNYIKLPAFPRRDPDKQVYELLDLDDPPRAIFAATDDLALQVLKVAQKRGIRIPEDLAVIGFDDIDFAAYLELTTISQSLYESGRMGAEHLIAQVSNPLRPVENTFIQLRLIERSTT